MKVLVLGTSGMLGNCVAKYITDVIICPYRWPTPEFKAFIRDFDGDFIINCIGAIPQRTNNFTINVTLPIFLDMSANCNVIHAGTDCESDDCDYGLSKKAAADWILSKGVKTKIIKSSIIGFDKEKVSLLSWALSNYDVNGYEDAKWNGITTLKWAEICSDMMKNWDDYEVLNILTSERQSKYDLLLKIKEIFGWPNSVKKVLGRGKDKTLTGTLTSDIKTQLEELKNFYANFDLNRNL